jgi:MFS transporter, DHA1 family, multidrug resistance protein
MRRSIPRRIAPGSRAFIALIAVMMTMTAMTIDINLPSIPATAADLGTAVPVAQFTVTIFFAGFAVGQLVWGPLSDRIGRRLGVLIGTGIFVVATIGCALPSTSRASWSCARSRASAPAPARCSGA